MPIYVFRCARGHETEAIRQLGDKVGVSCPSCGAMAKYDLMCTVRPTGSFRKAENWFSEKERDVLYFQTGQKFDRARDLDDYCESNGKEVVHGGGMAAKRAAERSRENDARLHEECKRIWAETMLG